MMEPKNQVGKFNAKKGSIDPSTKKTTLVCHEDIEPDDLIPAYLDTRAKLFQIQRPQQDKKKAPPPGHHTTAETTSRADDLEEQRLLAKLDRIEQDVLFDKPLGEHKWRAERIVMEKDYAAAKKSKDEEQESAKEEAGVESDDTDDEVAREAKKMAVEILEQDNSDDDQALSDLFASLPTQEIDEKTGQTRNVVNGADGVKTYLQDFGKWTGINPTQVLQETCRSRYAIDSESSTNNTNDNVETPSARSHTTSFPRHHMRPSQWSSSRGLSRNRSRHINKWLSSTAIGIRSSSSL